MVFLGSRIDFFLPVLFDFKTVIPTEFVPLPSTIGTQVSRLR
jgi:hypothetical protein